MSDIFLSYAREDAVYAQRIAAALNHNDWSVWWDEKLLPGSHFSPAIQEELAAAKCVIVLWSRASLQSNWVPDEAENARERDVLLPVLLEAGICSPMGYRSLHYADLSSWTGDPADPTFQKLLHAIRDTVERSGGTLAERQPRSGWPEGMPHLARDIPLARTLHGYSGKWKVKSIFSRWRDRTVGASESVVFNGETFLCIERDGKRGWGMQIGVLEADLEGYSETRMVGNKIVEAHFEENILVLSIENHHRCVPDDGIQGKPPGDFGKDRLQMVKGFRITLEPVAGESKRLLGKHTYDPNKLPSQLAEETWDYLEV